MRNVLAVVPKGNRRWSPPRSARSLPNPTPSTCTNSWRSWPPCSAGRSYTEDTFYAHTDAVAAAANSLFGGIVAHGYLVVSLAAGLFVKPESGPALVNFGADHLRVLARSRRTPRTRSRLTVKQITPPSNADYSEIRWERSS
jgi:MaoC like domain